MQFEWDEEKAIINFKKHGIAFEEAVGCFYDPYQVAFEDPEHSEDEFREILIGHSKMGKLLIIVYSLRDKVIRIISARSATKKEAKTYAEGI